jgi:hypothetical protein
VAFAKVLEEYVAQQQKLSQSNVFTDFAEQNTPAAVKAHQRAAAKRREKAVTKALQERNDLFCIWKKWRRERIEALLAGPHSAKARALIAFLETMTLDQSSELIEFVRAAGWQHTDLDVKFEILSMVNTALTVLRERAGLPEFDDGTGISRDEEPTAFIVIRELFR